jgi:chromosome segregation ATPase
MVLIVDSEYEVSSVEGDFSSNSDNDSYCDSVVFVPPPTETAPVPPSYDTESDCEVSSDEDEDEDADNCAACAVTKATLLRLVDEKQVLVKKLEQRDSAIDYLQQELAKVKDELARRKERAAGLTERLRDAAERSKRKDEEYKQEIEQLRLQVEESRSPKRRRATFDPTKMSTRDLLVDREKLTTELNDAVGDCTTRGKRKRQIFCHRVEGIRERILMINRVLETRGVEN